MKSLATSLEGETWQVAITHGDYHPNNLIVDGKILTGIDIGGSSYLPIYKDMARSMVHLARRNIFAHEGSIHGVSAELSKAYCDRFDLSQFEQNIVLPFFIGFECLIKVEQPNAPAWRIAVAETLYDGFLASF